MTNKFSIYTQLLVDEAVSRNISVHSYDQNTRNIAILSLNGHSEIIDQSLTDLIGAARSKFVGNKATCNAFLLENGFPAPQFIYTNDLTEANAFLNKYHSIAVKPLGLTGGQGITTNITSSTLLESAFDVAQRLTKGDQHKIICQENLIGDDHRILVINYQEIFAIKRVPAYVIGDGINSIHNLIENWNNTLAFSNRHIPINEKTLSILTTHHLTLDSIVPAEQKVVLSDVANSHAGGISIDVTDQVSSELKSLAIDVCRSLQIPVAGIDIISQDIATDVGKIIEINVQPGLSIHHFPTLGKPHNPAKALIDMLFPESIHSSSLV